MGGGVAKIASGIGSVEVEVCGVDSFSDFEGDLRKLKEDLERVIFFGDFGILNKLLGLLTKDFMSKSMLVRGLLVLRFS